LTDIPIIFSAPMVLALISGRKTQTRRLAWRNKIITERKTQNVKPGDRLWVRENLAQQQGNFLGIKQNVLEAIYAADKAEVLNEHEFNLLPWWKGKGGLPSIHMPRNVSRITLVVAAAKIEPIQSMSRRDARAEGVVRRDAKTWEVPGTKCESFNGGPVGAFSSLWMSLHGLAAWSENPEVVAMTFAVHHQNIDRMKQEAA